MALDWSFGNLEDLFFDHKAEKKTDQENRQNQKNLGVFSPDNSLFRFSDQKPDEEFYNSVAVNSQKSHGFEEPGLHSSQSLPPKSPKIGVVAPSQVARARPLFRTPLKRGPGLEELERQHARNSPFYNDDHSLNPTQTTVGNASQAMTSDHSPSRSSRIASEALVPPSVRSSQVQTSRKSVSSQAQPPTWTASQAQVTPLSPSSSQYRTHIGLDELESSRTDFIANTPLPLNLPALTPGGNTRGILKLRPVAEIPEKFQSVFSFPYFNAVQSEVFDDVFYSDKPLVLGAPTGSGKTVVFELAIIRLLLQNDGIASSRSKVVYMAPIKALCSERYEDWNNKFGPLGVKCMELTGDSEFDDYFQLQDANIILTTPEKWDSMTRRWRDNKSLVQLARLFLIDEVHMLSDESRGATMEAVVSRMKTVHAVICRDEASKRCHDDTSQSSSSIRFVAVSATVPNVEDISSWLSSEDVQAAHYRIGDECRPVRLRKVVLGYPCSDTLSGFKFDLSLNYKLSSVIETYSEGKPTLVFCATRKGTQQAAGILAKDSRYIHSSQHKQRLLAISNTIRDAKLRDLLVSGIAYHHAGMDQADRKTIETLFASGQLPALFCTSTLAMGVNLPAHLVIVKSTQHYCMGLYQEYTETQILQMIGRAGRPQFDTSATAVILTRMSTKRRYESLLNGTELIESSLHLNLTEHLNAEIVLGVPCGLTTEKVEQKLQELCLKNLNQLAAISLVRMDEDCFELKPSDTGRLMARYCIAYDTMKNFNGISGNESLSELLELVCKSREFEDIQLRTNEKKILNTLNKDKNRVTIRFELPGKIKNSEMKVNCLIQAQFGCLTIQDFALQQDSNKIFRVAQRVARCLVEVMWQRHSHRGLVNAVLLSKSFKARLWENSKYVSRQISGIGPALASALVNAGLCNFSKIEETNPRDIERIVNRHPPFGNHVKDAVSHLPKYELCLDQSATYAAQRADVTVTLTLANADLLRKQTAAVQGHTCVLVVGDADNKVVFKTRIHDSQLLSGNGSWSKRIEVTRAVKGEELDVHLISQDWAGLDVHSTYTPFYSGPKRITGTTPNNIDRYDVKPLAGQHHDVQDSTIPIVSSFDKDRKPCSHRCADKLSCLHECCKQGVPSKHSTQTAVDKFRSGLKHKIARSDSGLLLSKRAKEGTGVNQTSTHSSLAAYSYNPKPRLSLSTPQPKGWDDLDLCTERLKATDWSDGAGLGDLPDIVDDDSSGDDFQRQSTNNSLQAEHHSQMHQLPQLHYQDEHMRHRQHLQEPQQFHNAPLTNNVTRILTPGLLPCKQTQNPTIQGNMYSNDEDFLPSLPQAKHLLNRDRKEKMSNSEQYSIRDKTATSIPLKKISHASIYPRKKFTFKTMSTDQRSLGSQASCGESSKQLSSPTKHLKLHSVPINTDQQPLPNRVNLQNILQNVSAQRQHVSANLNAPDRAITIPGKEKCDIGIFSHPSHPKQSKTSSNDFCSASSYMKSQQDLQNIEPTPAKQGPPEMAVGASSLVERFNTDEFSDDELYLMKCDVISSDQPALMIGTSDMVCHEHEPTISDDQLDLYRGSFSPICGSLEVSFDLDKLPAENNDKKPFSKEVKGKATEQPQPVIQVSDLIGNIFDGIF